jgi:hypothetical protein
MISCKQLELEDGKPRFWEPFIYTQKIHTVDLHVKNYTQESVRIELILVAWQVEN